MQRHGGQILVDQLTQLGVRRVFSVPGESFLAVLDGLYDAGIDNIVCRQEGGVAMMAEAYGKITGQPGVAFVTRGPGATNASAGVHIAMQDSTPMVLFVGQIRTQDRDREAFQEVDYKAMFGSIAKWVAEVNQTDRLPEYIARAFNVATAGRPGPVVLALPEDMLSAMADVPDIKGPIVELAPTLATVAEDTLLWLSGFERPLVVVGGPHWSPEAANDLATFASVQNLPVALGFRRQDYIDNRHPNYAGDLNVGVNPRLAQRVKDADALLVIGSRLGDIETQGYTLVDPAEPHLAICHVHADPNEQGHVYRPDVAVTADGVSFTRALADLPAADRDWSDWTKASRADYDAWKTPQDTPGDLKLEQVITWLSENLPQDAILTNGAGNYAGWLHRYFVFKQYGTQLAPTSGSMGYGFPAAISASLEYPERQVVCLAGDGCFQMTCNELSTAAQHGATPIVIVVNNGRYGTIRMHQEKHYPGRVSGTGLANPDFAALAGAYGGHGETVTTTADFAPAFKRAQKSGTFAVLELQVSEEALSTSATLAKHP
ncbi:thiamine pyrophosphate-binding protein [Octadecabacter sp. 1_MG-2023]|uniref:thiamine pyrophosphate-binding protein n=1 Tax=unclassified Octadecabacter TaxID=196158 RepID=UPI001C09D0D2|nr:MULTISPECIES: thiamine pyrophosphate-binding protein [unclassified Octadecabacter]MBU2992565.1 thiamine pyrophosphate-binding protein [Octadecabacter sp. B2R22]MDO6734678.1 thiamine pyrophosphate-binding protein [Octadecabacter sp. 1_MG-2023]